MPPKQRGHNTAGRDKLFRHAIEHVHVGIGYSVLGNFSLQLAAGGAHESASLDNSAFFVELNELLLSNTSTDFKKFRFEVLPLAETRELVIHHQKTIAHKLLLALGNKENNEGFYGFLKLSIAFVRDMQERFLVYFEAFHQIVNLGIYDGNNQLIPNVERFQLVFATQAAWMRELGSVLVKPEFRRQVRGSVIPACVRLMNDGKEYVRRLGAEVLASCCRQQRQLIPLAFDVAATLISKSASSTTVEPASAEEDPADESEEDEDERNETGDPPSIVKNFDDSDPIVDGMVSFVCELLRGLRGSLHTSFEDMFSMMVVAMRLVQLKDDGMLKALPNNDILSSIHQTWIHELDEESPEDMLRYVNVLARIASVAIPPAFRALAAETRKSASPSPQTDDVHFHPIHRLLSTAVNMLHVAASSPGCVHGSLPGILMVSLQQTLCSSHHAALQDLTAIQGPMAKFSRLLSSKGCVLEGLMGANELLGPLLMILQPICLNSMITSEFARAWLRKELGSVLVRHISKMIGNHKSSISGVPDTLFAFAQDIAQKNRAACLATERARSSSTDEGSDSEEYDSGEDATVVKKDSMKSSLSTAFVFEDFIDDVIGVPLLASIITWFCENALSQIHEEAGASTSSWTESTVLLLLMTVERTTHAESSPLHRIFEQSPNLCIAAATLLSRLLSICTSDLARNNWEPSSGSSSMLHMTLALLPHVLQNKDGGAIDACVRTIDSSIVAPCGSSPMILPIAAHATQVLTSLAACAMDIATTSSVKANAPKKKRGAILTSSGGGMSCAIAGAKKCLELVVLQTATMIGSKTSAELAANQTLTTTIRYVLGALSALVGRVKHQVGSKSGASSSTGAARGRVLSSRVVEVLSPSAQESLLLVLMKSLSSPSQPIRIQALKLLRFLCYEDEQRVGEAAIRVKGFSSVPAEFFDGLIGAETADPLSNSGNIDAAKMQLTKVSYEASVGHIRDALQGSILLHSCFGFLHIKFAAVWPIALKMITDVLRFEATAMDEIHGLSTAQRNMPLWDAVREEARDIVFSNTSGATLNRRSAANELLKDDAGSGASTYTLQFSDQQHHEEGSLVSKVFAGAGVQDHDQLGLMQFLKDRQRCDVSVVNTALTASPLSTDAFTVAKTFLGSLEEILKHIGNPFDQKVILVEELLFELHSVADGRHPFLTDIKGLDDRMHLVMRALLAAPTTIISETAAKHNSAWRHASLDQQQAIATRNQRLIAICNSMLPSTNFTLQRDAVENLKRLKVLPFDPYAPQILPFCGSNMKEAFGFLQTLHVEDDINLEHRIEYIAAVLVVVLPKLSQRVAKEKLKDQAVLSRRVMGMLNQTGSEGEGISKILTRAMEHILPSTTKMTAAVSKAEESPLGMWETYNFLSDMTSGDADEKKSSHYIRRFEQRIKQLTTAARVLEQFISAVGSKFQDWAARCFVILVEAYLFSSRSMHPSTVSFPSSAITAASGLRKVVFQGIHSLMDQFPAQVMNVVRCVRKTRMQLFVKELHSNSKTLASFTSVASSRSASGGTGVHSSFLKLVVVWVQQQALHALVAWYGADVLLQLTAALEAAPPGSDCVHRASSDTVFAALRFITEALQAADEPLDGESEETTLGTSFVDLHIVALFEALHRLVVHSSSDRNNENEPEKSQKNATNKPTGKRVMGFTVRMWGEVIQTVAYLSERVGREQDGQHPRRGNNATNSKKLHEMLGQMLEVALKFVSNPLCCVDNDTVMTATAVVETLIGRVAVIHPSQHYRRLVLLFNMVTNPQARQSLCRSFGLMVKKYLPSTVNQVAAQQFDAVGRVLCALNSFAAAPRDDEDEEDAREAEMEAKHEEGAEKEDVYDRYDFERRYHCFHSLMTFFNHNGNYGALQRAGPLSTVAVKTDDAPKKDPRLLPASTVRHERLYEGEDNVSIPLDKSEQPVLVSDALMAIAANIMFFLRDPERTIRSLASQTVFAILRYISGLPSEDGWQTACMNAVIRPIILSSLRQGVVAKDPSIRLAHMESIGGLAKHFPTQFPSFAALYSPNSERNFFLNVGHAQHKCRLNAFALLRKQSSALHVRDQLRVFVPFLLVLLKDYAQGKRSDSNAAGSGTLSEGRAKGFAESAIVTLAALVAHMPWEGYYHVLKLLLQAANENESLRLTMLRGVVQVLQSFHFLDELHHDRDALPSGSSSSDDEDPQLPEEPKKLKKKPQSKWKRAKIISILELEILPQLYRFITADKKSDQPGRKSEIRVSDLTAEKALGTSQSSSVNDTRAITQLPVAVAIAKIVRLFPEESFKTHIETLLHEIVLKLRTKNDKQRESARKVLCSVMREIGPGMLMFVVTKLKDNFVHGYQLHVLGYTIVTVLYTLYAPASPYALASRKQAKLIAKATTARQKSTPGDADAGEHDDGAIDEDGLPSVLQPQFDEGAGKAALNECTDVLFDVFMDDYLGAIGAQKEQIELMSTMPEVKKSRAVQGFIFLATHCDATTIMPKFLNKIAWVLAPPTANELTKKSGAGGTFVIGSNSKYSSGGDKKSVADIHFVNKVRFLSLRVARALMTNRSIDLGSSLELARTMIDRHNQVREEKISRFEAKDGTRRIRGAWASQIVPSKKTTKDRYEDNFTVAQRPERIDMDVNAATVLASSSQQKQKLRVYRGRYAKELGEASKSFALEDMEAAIVLDTLDEFCLKFLLSVLKRVLGIGKEKKLGSIAVTHKSMASNDDEVGHPEPAAEEVDDANDEEECEGLVTDEQVEEALGEEEEALEGAGDGTELDDLGVFAQEQDEDGAEANKQSRRDKKKCCSFASANKSLLEAIVPVILASLEGEGSDTVVSHSLDVLHALLVLRPPLDAVQTLGKSIFDTIVQFFSRGGVIKQRALRVVGAVVQHKRFVLPHDDATRLIHLIRSEMIDSTEYLPNSLLLLNAVLSKHVVVPEVYDVIGILTETMIHWAHAPPVRSRCVSCLVKFVTEYKMTRDKLKSHVDLYVRNLSVVSSTAQVALLELMDVLVSRFPQELLTEEAQVIFVPVCGVLCRGEYREGKEKAASVLGHLAVNAGMASIAPVLQEWLSSKSVSVRTSAYQALAVIIPELYASYTKYSEDPAAAVFSDIEFALRGLVGGCMTGADEVLSKKQRAKRDREAEEDTQVTAKTTLAKRERIEADRRTWQPIFFALRSVEAFVATSPQSAFVALGDEFVDRLFTQLLEHSHPWVRSTAYRVAVKYLYLCVEPQCTFLTTVLPQVSSSVAPAVATSSSPRVKKPTSSGGTAQVVAACSLPLMCAINPEGGFPLTNFVEAEQQLSRYSRFIKRVLATIVDHDVGNEKYEVNRAVEEAVRGDTVKVALYLAKAICQLCVALLCCQPQAIHVLAHYSSIWGQLVGLAQPALEQRTIDGYTVRVTTLTQLMGGLLTILPTATKGGDDWKPVLHVVSRITPAVMHRVVVPLIASCMESTYHTVSTIGCKVCEAVRQELHKRSNVFAAVLTEGIAPEAEDSPAAITSSARGKKTKKARTEVYDSAIPSHITVEDVVLQLTTKSNELRGIAKDEELKKQARKSIKRSRAE